MMEILNQYYINKATCVIIPVEKNVSKVYEGDSIFLVNKSTTSIIDDSCVYFGSSYKGRISGSKKILNMNYKLPIIIEEYNNLIFFPTSSPRFDDCSWISLMNIKSYSKDNSTTNVIFDCGLEFNLDISYYSFENQVFRATMLESLIRKRKNL